MNALNKITWNRLRIAGLVGGVLVLLLLATVVLVNVFTPTDDGQASLDEVGVVDGERVADLDEWGMLTPPVTEDPAVFGPLAAAALYTYDTRVANFQEATDGVKAWLMDFEREGVIPRFGHADEDELIWWSPFPNEDAYRNQSERQIRATAVVEGEPRVNEDHRDWSDGDQVFLENHALSIVTTDLEVTYEFTNDDGTRRTLVESVVVTAEIYCGQNLNSSRPTSNCVVVNYRTEYMI
ncbi:MAG: hypothetical protein CMF57_07230 [Leifsonia sp.]|jgi:hypothetical protein|nr:hypothetical protein [Leifsonia sp.]